MPTGGRTLRAVARLRRPFDSSPMAAFVVIFALFLVARVVMLAGSQVFSSFDSAVYAYRTDPSLNHGPLVSFTGHAPRPWGLPLFYAIFPDDRWRTVGQWAVGTFAWTLLAWELSRHLRTRAAQVIAFGSVLIFAALNNVATWDFAILTESMSISLGVMVVALYLRWARTGSTLVLAGVTAVALWWTFIRPDIRLFTGILVAILLGGAFLRRRRRARPAGGNPSPGTGQRDLRGALIASLVLIMGFAWYSAIAPMMDRTFAPYDGDVLQPRLPQDEQVLVYRLRVDVSTDPAMWAAFKTKLGMPTCPELEAFTSRTEWAGQEWAEAYRRCPALVAWVQGNKDEIFWQDLALADPALFARKFVAMTSYTLGGDIYARAPQVVPAPIEKLVYPSRRYGLPVALLGLAIGATLALVAGARQRHRLLLATSAVLAVSGILSAVGTITVHTGELQRFGLQETVAVRVATITLLAIALDSWLLGRRGRPDGAEPGQTATDRTGEAIAA